MCYLSNEEEVDGDEDEEESTARKQDSSEFLDFLSKSINELIEIQGDFEVRFLFDSVLDLTSLTTAFSTFSECSALNDD